MAAEIKIDKKTVRAFLEEGKVHQYLIPEYQRPYAWSDDQINTLYEDIMEFATTDGGFDHPGATYFLGSIVSYENAEKGVLEIIDGQQRLTSLCLLLRAIYAKLEPQIAQSKVAKNLASQIEPALWKIDPRTGDVDRTKPLFRSEVISDGGNETIKYILMTGKIAEGAKDNYSKNYRKFNELLEKTNRDTPLFIFDFVHALLNQCIVLPITADTQDAALTIFSTLNNRGLPLSDADIFKAKIYSQLQHTGDEEKKASFVKEWKMLEARSEAADESVQSLFYYDMFFERAKEKDQKSTTPGVRKFFLSDNAQRLYSENLIGQLGTIMTLFEFVNKGIIASDESWMMDVEIAKSLDVLKSYPNEFWKYPVIAFYLKYHSQENFIKVFSCFLRRLIAYLLLKHFEMPTISAIKGDILKLDASIIESDHPVFAKNEIDCDKRDKLLPYIFVPHAKIVRMLLKLMAYERQDELLPSDWEVEHIFPQRWETGYFSTVSDDEVRGLVEHLGNKVPLEKIKNIKASNGFFAEKKKQYQTSKIAIARDLCSNEKWGLEQIKIRDVHIADEVIDCLLSWIEKYDSGEDGDRG